MKKIIGLVIVMLIAFIAISNVVKAGTTGVVTTETVRLRREATTDSSVLELISKGTELEILAEEDGWYKVKYDDLTGYVSSDYVEITSTDTITSTETTDSDDTDNVAEEVPDENNNEVSDAEDNTATDNQEDEVSTVDSKETEFVLSADATLRLIPSFTSQNTGLIASGTKVTVVDTLNKWVKITDGTTTGWVVRQNV